MRITPAPVRRLLVEGQRPTGWAARALVIAANGNYRLEPLFPQRVLAQANTSTWLVATTAPDARSHPWDLAHRFVSERGALHASVAADAAPPYAEPDLLQAFPYRSKPQEQDLTLDARRACQVNPMDGDWPPTDLAFGWHLSEEYAGLKAARDRAGQPAGSPVRVGHLDTGFDPQHKSIPLHLRPDLARNFVDGGSDATDPAVHFPGTNPGHGTATLALLAGRQLQPPLIDTPFNDFLGGAPYAEVVPIRIANSVVHFYTSAMAQGIAYAASSGCRIASISMGGVPSRAWAVAVNDAYEAGVAIFAAAGNCIGGLPTRLIVYPARFGRVAAVCGVTAAHEPYYRDEYHLTRRMEGNFGPDAKMGTALAAFTPNMPWAEIGCGDVIDVTGAGTSAATPQAAAAAALWLQTHDPQPANAWQRVEAVRNALFVSADKRLGDRTHFGQGFLQANKALDVAPDFGLAQTPADDVSFPWLHLLPGFGAAAATRQKMLEVEAAQVAMSAPIIEEATGGADPQSDTITRRELEHVVTELRKSPLASGTLRGFLGDAHKKLRSRKAASATRRKR